MIYFWDNSTSLPGISLYSEQYRLSTTLHKEGLAYTERISALRSKKNPQRDKILFPLLHQSSEQGYSLLCLFFRNYSRLKYGEVENCDL